LVAGFQECQVSPGFTEVRIEADGALEGGAGPLGFAGRRGKGCSECIGGVGIVRVGCGGLFERSDCFLMMACSRQDPAEFGERGGVSRFERERASIGGRRGLPAAQLGEGEAEVGLKEAGVRFQCRGF
jgi:hypothetical protein